MNKSYYKTADTNIWKGRIDDEEDYDAFRWHQIVQYLDLSKKNQAIKRGFGLLGFCCDKGVSNNLGRTGTSQAPNSIRKEMANLPCSFPAGTKIYDCGNIISDDGQLEDLQLALADAVHQMLQLGLFPIILGGGHEIAYGHYLGIERFLEEKNLINAGVFNLDAHFDMRPYSKGASSGTMFAQIADRCQQKDQQFKYMVAGIQQYGNTVSLFKKAQHLKVKYRLARDISNDTMPAVREDIARFAEIHDNIYLTLCSDVISSAYAPGVSAPQPFGLHPEIILKIIKMLIQSGKVISFDIAEVSPRFDEDNRTSKLAAIIIFAVINSVLKFGRRKV